MNDGVNFFFFRIRKTGTKEKQRQNLGNRKNIITAESICSGQLAQGEVACKIIISMPAGSKRRTNSQLLGKDVIAGSHASVGGLFKVTFSRLFPFLRSQD